jgi:excisionase family DNA binding protein
MKTQFSLEEPLLTVPQVSKYLQISKAKLYYLIARRQFPHIRLDRNVRIRLADLEKWLNQKAEKSSD